MCPQRQRPNDRDDALRVRRTILGRLAGFAAASILLAWPALAVAQDDTARFELAVQVPSTMSSQFDRSDVGVGGRFGWHPAAWVGLESELVLYPGSFPDRVPFSRRRVEGLFGGTMGPAFARARPFVKLRAGFLDVQEAPQPFACILIFPPPLPCTLASGRTLPAFDLGGGIEIFATARTFARVEAGDRLLRYPGPAFDANRTRRDGAFFSHDFRFAAGGGLRF
jgi:hypothetical protein